MVTGGSPRRVVVEVPDALQGQRLDRVVALLGGLSRAAAGRLVDSGAVRVDGGVEHRRRCLLRAGQQLQVELTAADDQPVPDPDVDVTVVFEDDDIVVVDKPAGLVVHRGAGRTRGTLVDGLLARYPDLASLPAAGCGDAARPGIVHRLDKDTSGLLVVARSPRAFRSLTAQFRAHRAQRTYLALVDGHPAAARGTIDAPIGRSIRQPTKMAVVAGGRPARTSYRVLRQFSDPFPTALLHLELETGRTHQVRVHLAAVGHPVVGDARYATAGAVARHRAHLPIARQFLHAAALTVDHPDGTRRTWTAPVPADLEVVLDHCQPAGG